MDPYTCLLRWRNSVANKNPREAARAKADLAKWIANGGFAPKMLTNSERVLLTLAIPRVVPGSTVRV